MCRKARILEGDVFFARGVALVHNSGSNVLTPLEEVLNATGSETKRIDVGALRRPRINFELVSRISPKAPARIRRGATCLVRPRPRRA